MTGSSAAVRPPAGVDRGPGGPDRGAQGLRQLFQDHVVLGALHAAPARQHDLGLGELGQAGGGLLAPLDERHEGVGHRHRGSLYRRRGPGPALGRPEDVGPERRHPGRPGPRRPREQLAGVHGARGHEALAVAGEGHRVGRDADAQARGQPGQALPLPRRDRAEDRPGRLLLGQPRQRADPDLAPVGREGRVLQEPDLRRAPFPQLPQAVRRRLVGEPDGFGGAAQAGGLAQHLGHHLLGTALPVVLHQTPERAAI